jgi:hypothetical protein
VRGEKEGGGGGVLGIYREGHGVAIEVSRERNHGRDQRRRFLVRGNGWGLKVELIGRAHLSV